MSGPRPLPTPVSLAADTPPLGPCSTLVAHTPRGWAAMCLDCIGNDGGPFDLGEWTEEQEAHLAVAEHRLEPRLPDTCPACGHTLPCPIPPPPGEDR